MPFDAEAPLSPSTDGAMLGWGRPTREMWLFLEVTGMHRDGHSSPREL